MALSDDGEADDSDAVATKSKPVMDSEALKRKRQEREEALRRMMDDDEEEEEDKASEKSEEQPDEEMEDAPEPEPEPEPKKEDKEPAEVVSSSADGRRRGKRRVMQKKRILDDQGYMGKSRGLKFRLQDGFANINGQSRYKNPAGNRSRKTRHFLPSKSQRRRRRRHLQVQRRKSLRLKGRETSCPFSPRSKEHSTHGVLNPGIINSAWPIQMVSFMRIYTGSI